MKRRLLNIAVFLGFLTIVHQAHADDTTVVIPSTGVYVVPASTTPVAVPVVAPTTVIVNQPPPATKDEDDDAWGEFNIGGGMAMFKGSSSDYLDDSPAVGMGFFGPMGHAGEFGLEVNYITGADVKGTLPGRLTPNINGNPATGPFTTTAKAHIMSGTPEFRFGPQINRGSFKIMPYIVGGGGIYWTHYNNDELDFTQGSASLPSTNDYNGGWNAGGGLTIGLAHGFGIGVDVRYHDIIYKDGPDTTYLMPQGKFVFFF